jgi:ribosomal protein S18 acetylase RimI-like enzyme
MTDLQRPAVEYNRLSAEQARDRMDELSELFLDVYSEPPYLMGEDEVHLFQERFEAQRQQEGFSLVTARGDGKLIGFIFGVTLLPTTQWWSRLLTSLPPEIVEERPGRTFAVVELVVRRDWRRRRVAEKLHDMLLTGRPEERATLTARPDAGPAQAAYAKWGWRKVGQKRNPLPGNPLYDILVKPLR